MKTQLPHTDNTTYRFLHTTYHIPLSAYGLPHHMWCYRGQPTTDLAPGTAADLPGTAADLPGTAADLPGTAADLSGTAVDLSGTAADLSGTAADPSAGCLEQHLPPVPRSHQAPAHRNTKQPRKERHGPQGIRVLGKHCTPIVCAVVC